MSEYSGGLFISFFLAVPHAGMLYSRSQRPRRTALQPAFIMWSSSEREQTLTLQLVEGQVQRC